MPAERVRFRDVLRVREFRALWLAQTQSLIGDQLARVALAVLVYQRTGSASITALVYALTFVPAILGGALMGGLADHLPRRTLMITCDLLRAAIVAAMAIPSLPLQAVAGLLVVAVLLGQPFAAAETALLPDILAGEHYVVGSGLRMMTSQLGQLIGFAGGGLAVAAIGARGGLLVDAATYALSALVLSIFLADRRPVRTADPDGRGRRWAGGSGVAAARIVYADARLRTLAGLGLLAALHVVPEGIASPYAAAVGGGASAVGLLMAALPAGTALGVLVLVRLPHRVRDRLLGPLAVATALPLIACAAKPGLDVSIALWTLVGFCSAYQIQAATSFVRLLPEAHRGQLIGIVSSGVIAMQGIGIVAFGTLATHIDVRVAVACAGLTAAALALPLAAEWGRQVRHESASSPVRPGEARSGSSTQ